MEAIQEIKQFLEHIEPRVGENAFTHVWQTVEEVESQLSDLVKERDRLKDALELLSNTYLDDLKEKAEKSTWYKKDYLVVKSALQSLKK